LIPRYYQTEAHDAVWDFINNESGNPLVVLPTGAGKSLVIAMICQQAVEFGARVVVLQHRKELIAQNAEKIKILMPSLKVGIYSAGMKSRQAVEDVVCAGIQSIYRKALLLGRRELIVIDEAHLVSPEDDTMYGQFLSDAKVQNSNQRVVGLTATPFRTGEGEICRADMLFQSICYESQTGTLIKEGFLSPVVNRVAVATVSSEGIPVRGGEFVTTDVQSAFMDSGNTELAVAEIVEKAAGRMSCLLFASCVLHANEIAIMLSAKSGENVEVITGETFPMERAAILSDFKSGRLRWLVNCDVLTTGFDAPNIDAIAVLRMTMSPGLFAQIVGRGLRKSPGKTDCLVLDFGGNIKRHGALDDPAYGRFSVQKREGDASDPIEGGGFKCPNCQSSCSSRLTVCPSCGFIFPPKHEAESDDESAIIGGPVLPRGLKVLNVHWAYHVKRGGTPDDPATLRIDYDCTDGDGSITEHVSEWVCLDHVGFARVKAEGWWREHSIAPVPASVEDAIEMLDCGCSRWPDELFIVKEGRYTKITNQVFLQERPLSWKEPVAAGPYSEFSGSDDDVPF